MTSNGPPFVSPMNATPAFSGGLCATVRSTPAPSRQGRLDLIDGLAVERQTPDTYSSPTPPTREKQTSNNSQPAPSITDGSSLRASKTCRFFVPVVPGGSHRHGWNWSQRSWDPAVLSPAILPARLLELVPDQVGLRRNTVGVGPNIRDT